MFSTCTFLWENGGTTKPNYNLVEGWNSVTINHPDGCTVVDSVFIPSPAPVIDSFLVQNLNCYNDNSGMIELYPSQPGNVNFAWSHGASVDSVYNLWAGNFSVIVTDSRPCIDTLNFTITQPDSIQFTTDVNNVNCHSGNDGSIAFNTNGGTVPYAFYLNNLQNQNPVLNNLIAGSYTLNFSDANGCFGASQQVTISEPSEILIEIYGTAPTGWSTFDGWTTSSVSGGIPPYEYQWNDGLLQEGPGAWYLSPGWFTLTVTDSSGCIAQDSIYLGIAEIQDISSTEIVVYPNPSDNIFNLWVPKSLIGTECVIRNLNGQIILEQDIISDKSIIDLSAVSSGIYMLNLSSGEVLRLVKE
jgi:hypothetical protein